VRSSIDVANAKQALLAARAAERSALIVFNNLLARQPGTPEVLSDDMSQTDALPAVQLPSLTDLYAQATKNRPLLKAATEQTRAASYAVKQAEAARFPDLGVDFQRSVRFPTNALQLTASFPLLDFGSIGQSIRAAKATRKQTEALQKQTAQQIDLEVAQAHSNLDTALQSAADYKREILDPSVTLLGMAQLGYQQGATGILPVIDAQATIRNARVGYINSLLAIHLAEDQVLAATGTLPPTTSR
jgi:outer membrane protein TolC